MRKFAFFVAISLLVATNAYFGKKKKFIAAMIPPIHLYNLYLSY